jgi:hypothetical protein
MELCVLATIVQTGEVSSVYHWDMRAVRWLPVVCTAAVMAATAPAQVIEFESNGLKYHALTRNELTLMVAWLPSSVRDYFVLQVAVSNGSSIPQTLKPEDFLLIREDGAEVPALPARTVVNSLMDRASRGDVVRLITTYEHGIYGNSQYKSTNGYEQRRQSALAEFTSTRVRAAAAASAIAFVQIKLAPGQSTDGAIFFPAGSRAASPSGTVRVRVANAKYEFPLLSSNQSP